MCDQCSVFPVVNNQYSFPLLSKISVSTFSSNVFCAKANTMLILVEKLDSEVRSLITTTVILLSLPLMDMNDIYDI